MLYRNSCHQIQLYSNEWSGRSKFTWRLICLEPYNMHWFLLHRFYCNNISVIKVLRNNFFLINYFYEKSKITWIIFHEVLAYIFKMYLNLKVNYNVKGNMLQYLYLYSCMSLSIYDGNILQTLCLSLTGFDHKHSIRIFRQPWHL